MQFSDWIAGIRAERLRRNKPLSAAEQNLTVDRVRMAWGIIDPPYSVHLRPIKFARIASKAFRAFLTREQPQKTPDITSREIYRRQFAGKVQTND